jgi:ribonuclease D
LTNEENKEVAELPLLAVPRFPAHYISNQTQLEAAFDALKNSKGPIAIDAERASGFKYSQRAYLVQLRASQSEIYLLDPVLDPELLDSKPFTQLRKLLMDREWILHAATQDLACLAEIGLRPGAIFDTELAARLTGQPKVGLGSLTESLIGVRLAKEHSAADWSTRPLPQGWLNYAALDVDVLHDLKSSIEDIVRSQNKTVWVQQEFDNLLSFAPKPQREDRWRSLSGLIKVSDRQVLEIARQLWQAREDLAKKMDIAPGRLIPDAAIAAAAIAKPKSRSELSSLRTFTGRASRSYLTNWWEAIDSSYKSNDLPELRPKRTEGIPNHRAWANKFPEADKRLRLAKESLTKIAVENFVPLENLLTPDYLRQISFTPPERLTEKEISAQLKALGARSWQRELTSQAIAKAFVLALEPEPNPVSDSPPESVEHEEL